MSDYVVLRSAGLRIDDIYRKTVRKWGLTQANKYINGLFQHFESVAGGSAQLKPIPAEFEVVGNVSRYEKHYVYSKILASGELGIVTILHQRMHQIKRFGEDFSFTSIQSK